MTPRQSRLFAETFEFCPVKEGIINPGLRRARDAITIYSNLPYFCIVLDSMDSTEAKLAIRAAKQRNDIPAVPQKRHRGLA